MSGKYLARYSIDKTKSNTNTSCLSDNHSSAISTFVNTISKDQKETNIGNKNLEDFDFEIFLNSKRSAFQFAPIFGTIKNVTILNASTIEGIEDLKCLQTSPNKNILESFDISDMSSPKNQCNNLPFQTDRTESLYNENLLSSGFCSGLDE